MKPTLNENWRVSLNYIFSIKGGGGGGGGVQAYHFGKRISS